MCVCVCVCVYVYVCVCVYVYVYICVCIYIYIYTHHICIYSRKSSFVFAIMCFPAFLASDDNDSGISELLSGGEKNGRESEASKKSKLCFSFLHEGHKKK